MKCSNGTIVVVPTVLLIEIAKNKKQTKKNTPLKLVVSDLIVFEKIKNNKK